MQQRNELYERLLQGKLLCVPSMLLNSIWEYDCMDAGGRTTQEQLSTTAWMQEVEQRRSSCRADTELPLNDQIMNELVLNCRMH